MTGEQLYTVGEVAAIVGVSPHTIRAWERRHGMVSPVRTSNQQRRYRAEDVELLRHVKQEANVNGVSLKIAYQAVKGAQTIAPRGASSLPGGRVHASAELSERNLWRQLVDALPVCVLVIDADGGVVECNVGAAKTFGVVVQRLRGRPFTDLVEWFDRDKAELLYRGGLQAVRGWELNLATEGGPRLHAFQSWFVRAAQGTLLALVGSPVPTDELTRGVEA